MTVQIPKLLTLDRAAQELGLTIQQLRWLRSQNKGPKGAKLGGRVFFREADLASWVNDSFSTEASSAEAGAELGSAGTPAGPSK